MRITVEVTELSPLQFERLDRELVTSYAFGPNDNRVCASFMAARGTAERHVEMPVYELTTALSVLRQIAVAEAALAETSGEVTPVLCEHGAELVEQTPSAFAGAEPIRSYADGCQTFGPYSENQQPLVLDVEAPKNEMITVAELRAKNYDPEFADRLENGAYDQRNQG